jgi:hypothetical protein
MNLLFELSSDPFEDDLSAQYARMALAVSMENKVTMVYRDEAAVLAKDAVIVPMPEVDYFNQERFLVEQEVDMYLMSEDLKVDRSQLKDCIKIVRQQELERIYKDQDVIFRK